jgi:hypothetical protein
MWDQKKDQFFCARRMVSMNYNKKITAELEKLLKVYSTCQDKGRTIAYKRAILAI